MYRDLVFRPGVDTTIAETLPYKYGRPHTSINPDVELLREAYDQAPMRRGPGSGGGIVADRPTDYGMDEIPRTASVDAFGPDFIRKIEDADRAAKTFLDLFMLDRGLVAGYVPFKGVAPADIDVGGPESPESFAQLNDFIQQLRDSGKIDRARRNLRKQGYPLGGV
jgi:hypothetical protein